MSCTTGNLRHWFNVYGNPGLRSPICVRCGAPNPRKLTDTELAAYLAYRRSVAR